MSHCTDHEILVKPFYVSLAVYTTTSASLKTPLPPQAESEILQTLEQLDAHQRSAIELDSLCKEEAARREKTDRRVRQLDQSAAATLHQTAVLRDARARARSALEEAEQELREALEDASRRLDALATAREAAVADEGSARAAAQEALRVNSDEQGRIRALDKDIRHAESERLKAMAKFESVSVEYGRAKSLLQARTKKIDALGRTLEYEIDIEPTCPESRGRAWKWDLKLESKHGRPYKATICLASLASDAVLVPAWKLDVPFKSFSIFGLISSKTF
jgi:hypothetical protein